MYDKKSIYAVNKSDPDAIIYTNADSELIRLTRENFDTEADFLKWKAWSDADYHTEEKGNHVHANHTIPMDSVADKSAAVESPEITIETKIEQMEKDRFTSEMVIRMKGQLTEKQFRRLWLYCVEGMTEQEIAKKEGRTHQGISKSINAAMKKILKIFLF